MNDWKMTKPDKNGHLALLKQRDDTVFRLTYVPPSLWLPGMWKLDVWDHGEPSSLGQHSDPQELIKIAEAFEPYKRSIE